MLKTIATLSLITVVLGLAACTQNARSEEDSLASSESEPTAGSTDSESEADSERPSDSSGTPASESEATEEGATEDGLAETSRPQPAGSQDEDDEHPFANQVDVNYEFPRDAEWMNTNGAIRMRDLRGKFVLFDFWTYCCINCIHVLPVLHEIEQKYPNEVVVIGVHSAKFETEKDAKNITEAILRYRIEHPVINDSDHRIWDSFGVRSWPTMLMFDPEGKAVWMNSGEVEFEQLDEIFTNAIPYYRKKGTLDETPIQFELHAFSQGNTPLLFPGKVLADEASDRLYIADSNHDRIVVSTLGGELVDVIGSGATGTRDGGYDEAEFNQPQGMALHNNQLIVADTENHLLRRVDLESKTVETIAGLGSQGRNAFPGIDKLGPLDDAPEKWVGKPLETAINSPWDVLVHEDEIFIAMAGPHQIWRMSADGTEIGPYAGNGREDIVDGPLVPKRPYDLGYSSFAQPSGLSSDGTWLYVADSEGSSIRAVPFDATQEVRTVVGTADLPFNRLFTFGDVDGAKEDVKLQHALGVVYHEGSLFITDTYNNKVKRIDAATGETTTLAGNGEAGSGDEPARFDEPAGLSLAAGKLYIADTNNHLIRTVDIKTGEVSTLEIAGLTRPARAASPKRRVAEAGDAIVAEASEVKAIDGHAEILLQLELPEGWKINAQAPMSYTVSDETIDGVIDNSALADDATRVADPSATVSIKLPLGAESGTDEVVVGLNYYYCQEGGEGLCKVGSVRWKVALNVNASAEETEVKLSHKVIVSPF